MRFNEISKKNFAIVVAFTYKTFTKNKLVYALKWSSLNNVMEEHLV